MDAYAQAAKCRILYPTDIDISRNADSISPEKTSIVLRHEVEKNSFPRLAGQGSDCDVIVCLRRRLSPEKCKEFSYSESAVAGSTSILRIPATE